MHASASVATRYFAGWFFRFFLLALPAAVAAQSPVVLELAGEGGRSYRVEIRAPATPPPPAGYPVLYLLDGNAALAGLPEAAAGPALIVAIGHHGSGRFDVAGRVFDFTPALTGGDEFDPLVPTRRAGGAQAFAAFIERRVKPAVAAVYPVDASRQGLWGHSYGGLFVLHTLLTRSADFRCYAAASPSLWWRDGYLPRLAQSTSPAARQTARLLVTRGGAEMPAQAPQDDLRALAVWQLRNSVPVDAAAAFAAAHSGPAEYLELPGLNHGEAFAASLAPTLAWFARCIEE